MFVLEKYWWTLVSSWPDELEKVDQLEKNVLKRKYKKPQINYQILYTIYVYFVILTLF